MNKPKKIKDGKNGESEAIEIYEHPFKAGAKIVVWQDKSGSRGISGLWYLQEEEGKEGYNNESWMPRIGMGTKKELLTYICEIYKSK